MSNANDIDIRYFFETQMPFYAQHIRQAQVHLKANDPVMRDLIRKVGPFTLKTHKHPFQSLIRSIIAQQISVSAAKTIIGRVVERVGEPLIADAIARLSVEELRELGVSQQKASYCLDLARHVLDGQVNLQQLNRRSDAEIIDELVQVKGIGVWTAQMFLIFCLGRLDVLPVDDLGIKNAVMQTYGLRKQPDAGRIQKLAQPWRPYASIASWYLWRSLELPK
ncbi:MAG: DNA-3-methyladenine glycosylase 2 family protein [Pirellulaceae bacterium]|nr:DNA-3-methyladenine glycosylase 2 family protein [Pirellulaceae bacterium]